MLALIVGTYHDALSTKHWIPHYCLSSENTVIFYKLVAVQSSLLRKWSFILLFIKAYYIILFNHCNTQHALSLRTVLQIYVQIHYAERFSLPTPNELCLWKRIVIQTKNAPIDLHFFYIRSSFVILKYFWQETF